MSYGSLYSGTASRLITLVSGSATVTFSGTVLTEEDIRALDTLYADGAVGKVKAIVDAATLELLRPWPGPNRSGYQAWDIARDAPARLDPVEAAAAMTQAYGFASLINGQTRVMRVESEGNAPPGSPLEGRYYLAGPAPSGWPLPVSAGDLVRRRGGTYGVITPETGWLVLIVATGQLKRFGGGAWSQVTAEPAVIRTAGGNSARTILSTERLVALTAALTAPRVWTLPAANAVAAGATIDVVDEVGGISSTNTLTLQRAGADTIDGAATLVLGNPYEGARLVSDGASKWTVPLVSVSAGGTGARAVSAARINLGLRDVLAADKTVYVATGGNDSNSGAAGAPFATIQRAIEESQRYDLRQYNFVVSLAAGTYTAGGVIKGPPLGSGDIIVDAGGSSGIINVTSGRGLSCVDGGRLRVRNAQLRSTTSGQCLFAATNGIIRVDGGVTFGAASSGCEHLWADAEGVIEILASYAITGGAGRHMAVVDGGRIAHNGSYTVTLTGTPAFSQFAMAIRQGTILIANVTYSGAATGARYAADTGAQINTASGGNPNYLPGNAAGSANGAAFALYS